MPDPYHANISTSSRPHDGAWTAATILPFVATAPVIHSTLAGLTTAVWNGAKGTMSAERSPGGAWSVPGTARRSWPRRSDRMTAPSASGPYAGDAGHIPLGVERGSLTPLCSVLGAVDIDPGNAATATFQRNYGQVTGSYGQILNLTSAVGAVQDSAARPIRPVGRRAQLRRTFPARPLRGRGRLARAVMPR